MQRWTSLWLSFSLAGCGNALVGTDYLGQPLYTFSGEVDLDDKDFDDLDLEPDTVRMALLWGQRGGVSTELQQDLVIETSFPAQYEMVLYHPPPDEVFVTPGEAAEAIEGPDFIDENAFAYGLPMAYVDDNGTSAFEEGEQILGITLEAFVFYMPAGFETYNPPDGALLLEDTFSEGYHIVAFDDRACLNDRPAPPRPAEEDDVDVLISDDLTSILEDIDCDGTLDEWSLLCDGDCPEPR